MLIDQEIQDIIAPMEEAFSSGNLIMPTDIAGSAGQAVLAWGSIPLNRWLIVGTVVLFVLNLGSFYHIFPHISKCVSRWRWNFTLEASMQLSRVRNIFALMMIAPFCLIVSRFDLLKIDLIKQYVPAAWMTGAVIGVLLIYLLIRIMMYSTISSKIRQGNALLVAHKTAYNFFVATTWILLATLGILYAFGASETAMRHAILLEMAVLYFVMLLWEGEILSGCCNPLTTFLYLCALEIIPTGLLIAANVCL